MAKVYRETFELSDIPFSDKNLEIEIKLYAKGIIEFMSDSEEAGRAIVKEQISGRILSAIDMFAQKGCGYEIVHRQPVFSVVKELADKADNTKDIFDIKNIYFTELHPVDADYDRIIQARKGPIPKEVTDQAVQISPSPLDEIKIKLAGGEYSKIEAINIYRQQTGAGLAEAKTAIERMLGE